MVCSLKHCLLPNYLIFSYIVFLQDVSRLVDLCRQSIVFDCVSDLAACLEVIAADPEVCTVRIKNRLDLAYDASQSGGYRDVAVNLRIVCQTAVELGVDGHVCEVQLILRPFADLKVIRHNSTSTSPLVICFKAP